jgi:hypothetical protein
MPTSRYWLQAFCSISTCFSFIASAEPGLSRERSSPTSRTTSLRIASAEAGLPRARSSITRSSIEIAKVTPAAFSTCRSSGASSQVFCLSRRSGGVLARIASRSPIGSPFTPRKAAAGSSSSHSALTVGNRVVTSKTPSSRTTTTAGPLACGSQTRPTSAPFVPSSGRRSFVVSVIMAAFFLWFYRQFFTASSSAPVLYRHGSMMILVCRSGLAKSANACATPSMPTLAVTSEAASTLPSASRRSE